MNDECRPQAAPESPTKTTVASISHREHFAGLRRRTEASHRLPPMSCGCWDPESAEHRDGRCRWRVESVDRQFMDEWLVEWHEPPRVPDGYRCIQCRTPAREGRISHARGCPEFRPARRTDAGGHPGTGMSPRDVYDRFVAGLTMRRPDRYDCPSCGARGDGHGLKVDLVGERILFCCFACRGGEEILAAVGLTWADLGGGS